MVFIILIEFLTHFVYSHRVVPACVLVLGLYALYTSFTHCLVAPYMGVGKSPVLLDNYRYRKQGHADSNY